MSKKKCILLHIVILLILTAAVFQYIEEIQTLKQAIYYTIFPEPVPGDNNANIKLYPVETTGEEWFADAPMIYHAGGDINGNVYTNSLEAIEKTLAEGHDFLEIDMIYTSDRHLVCAHSWLDVYMEDYQPTLEEFLNSRIQGLYTPLTAGDLLDIMRENPQMHLVTDIKDFHEIETVITDLVNLADSDPTILDRFVIQLYTGREKTAIQEIYPFADSQFVFTLYEWGVWDYEAAQICNEEGISVLTVTEGQIPDEDVTMLRQLGFTVYEHTINRADMAQKAIDRGVSNIYTDTLEPSDLIYP